MIQKKPIYFYSLGSSKQICLQKAKDTVVGLACHWWKSPE